MLGRRSRIPKSEAAKKAREEYNEIKRKRDEVAYSLILARQGRFYNERNNNPKKAANFARDVAKYEKKLSMFDNQLSETVFGRALSSGRSVDLILADDANRVAGNKKRKVSSSGGGG